MNKDFGYVVQILDDNFIETLDDLMDLTTEQCSTLRIPIGLVNKIKKEMAQYAANPVAAMQSAQTF